MTFREPGPCRICDPISKAQKGVEAAQRVLKEALKELPGHARCKQCKLLTGRGHIVRLTKEGYCSKCEEEL